MSLPAAHLPALQGHVMDRRKKALTDYKKLRAFFAEEEERFLQEADKEEGSPEDEDEDMDPAERFGSLLQAVSELERRHRNLGLSMLLQVGPCVPGPQGRVPGCCGVGLGTGISGRLWPCGLGVLTAAASLLPPLPLPLQ